MSFEWTEETLGDLISRDEAHLQTGPFGTALKASEYSEDGVPLISVREIREGFLQIVKDTPRVCEVTTQRLPKFLLQQGDIVFGRKGAVDRNAVISFEQEGWFLGSDGIRLRLSSKYDSLFFSYLMRSSATRAWLLQNSEGTTMLSLNQKTLARVPVKYPPIEIQKRVSTQLRTLDDKITLNIKINQTLEEMAQAIFKSWFVDFDPVKAKMSGSQPEGMDAATASLFPEKLVESDLGWVPFGWDVEPLDSIFTVNKGLSYKGKFLSEDKSDVPLINLGNFGGNGKFRYEKVKYYSGDYKPRHVVKAGQLVIANTDMTQDRVILGSAILVPELGAEEYLTTHHTFSTSFKKQYPEDVWKYFVFYSLQRPSFRFRAEGFATGTTVLAMPTDAFTFCTVALPPVELVEKFSALVQSLKQKIACNEKENVELTNLRDTLLPKLLSGEIELGQTEQLAEVS